MARKDVYIYDDTNKVLQVNGIQVELYNTRTGTLLDKQVSADLNPPAGGGPPSNEWGVKLNFPLPHNDPADIIITDKKYEYPGNVARHLYAGGSDRVNIDLLKIPSGAGGQQRVAPATTGELARWIEAAPLWSDMEKEAVKNLVFNYVNIFVSRGDSLNSLSGLQKAARNWEKALRRLEIDPETLKV
jgi:hypothetical protein